MDRLSFSSQLGCCPQWEHLKNKGKNSSECKLRFTLQEMHGDANQPSGGQTDNQTREALLGSFWVGMRNPQTVKRTRGIYSVVRRAGSWDFTSQPLCLGVCSFSELTVLKPG